MGLLAELNQLFLAVFFGRGGLCWVNAFWYWFGLFLFCFWIPACAGMTVWDEDGGLG